jgi:hypothetical protein
MTTTDAPARRPGDLIIDRYMPDATPEEREEAHANLRRFLKALLRVAVRVTKERHTAEDARPALVEAPVIEVVAPALAAVPTQRSLWD